LEVGQHWEKWVLVGDSFGSAMGVAERESQVGEATELLHEEYIKGMERRNSETKMQNFIACHGISENQRLRWVHVSISTPFQPDFFTPF